MSGNRVPPIIKKLLHYDTRVTARLVTHLRSTYPYLSTQSCSNYMKLIEISCHGLLWFPLTLISIYVMSSSHHNSQVNLLAALIYDVIAVGLLKALTRRHRPTPDSSSFGPDKFSFPSGHASRAILLACYFSSGSSPVVPFLLFSYAGVVCFSRILYQKHHVLDVLAGVLLGVAVYSLVSLLWISSPNSAWIHRKITGLEDEAYSGS